MRRYEPYHGYYDRWDETGEARMREAKDGDWVKYENAHNAIRMYLKQVERLKTQLRKKEDQTVNKKYYPGMLERGRVKCIVAGCENHTDQGQFVGTLCMPCHNFLFAGELKYHGNTFFAKAMAELIKWREVFKPLGETPDEAGNAVYETQIVWRPVSEYPAGDYRDRRLLITVIGPRQFVTVARAYWVSQARYWNVEGTIISDDQILAWAELPKPYVPPKPEPVCYMWVDKNDVVHFCDKPHPTFQSWPVQKEAFESVELKGVAVPK